MRGRSTDHDNYRGYSIVKEKMTSQCENKGFVMSRD